MNFVRTRRTLHSFKMATFLSRKIQKADKNSKMENGELEKEQDASLPFFNRQEGKRKLCTRNYKNEFSVSRSLINFDIFSLKNEKCVKRRVGKYNCFWYNFKHHWLNLLVGQGGARYCVDASSLFLWQFIQENLSLRRVKCWVKLFFAKTNTDRFSFDQNHGNSFLPKYSSPFSSLKIKLFVAQQRVLEPYWRIDSIR